MRAIVSALLCGTSLAGCSDIYYDRRETVALGADDHKATDEIVQIIDPWPRQVGNRKIAFDGNKMQTAVERYRTNKTTPLATTSTSTSYAPSESSATPSTSQ